jgi:hypothetical protein
MNITEFLKAIKYLKKSVVCPGCKKSYQNRDIYINDLFADEIFFVVDCRKCNQQNLIHVYNQAKDQEEHEAQFEESYIDAPQEPKRVHKAISQNDYLDVKNFLKGFDGDFKRIFQ